MSINTIRLDNLNLFSGAKVLDLGCGLGRHSLLAYRDYPVDVYGLDLSFDDLAQAKGRIPSMSTDNSSCAGKLLFAQANGYQLPFESHSFDVVICSEVLEHVPDYQGLLVELDRVLKPGGQLALSVPKFLPERLCWLLSKQYPEFAGHVRIFKGLELPSQVSKLGLRLNTKHSAHAFHSPYWWIRSLFFDRGDSFFPVKRYKSFMDWHLMNSPEWVDSLENLFNPLIGKSNVYYFSKAS